LQADRRALLRGDAWRSLAFILPLFLLLYFNLTKKISLTGFYAFLILLVALDLSFVDKRYFAKDKFMRKHDNAFAATAADEAILRDKSYYRVYNLQEDFSKSARTGYLHYSLNGYTGAKLRRYQDLYDSCLSRELQQLVQDAQKGNLDFQKFGVLNMLNTRYILYGPEATNIIPNPDANGNAWFVRETKKVASPNEELAMTQTIHTKDVAVIQSIAESRTLATDSTATIKLVDFKPPYLKYESQSSVDGVGVFSEIYYPKGWHAFIDGKETDILRADYVLRALAIPAGKHVIEFKFEPRPYVVGNKITLASNWAALLIALGCIGWTMKKETE
jgi:hypothetical protein